MLANWEVTFRWADWVPSRSKYHGTIFSSIGMLAGMHMSANVLPNNGSTAIFSTNPSPAWTWKSPLHKYLGTTPSIRTFWRFHVLIRSCLMFLTYECQLCARWLCWLDAGRYLCQLDLHRLPLTMWWHLLICVLWYMGWLKKDYIAQPLCLSWTTSMSWVAADGGNLRLARSVSIAGWFRDSLCKAMIHWTPKSRIFGSRPVYK